MDTSLPISANQLYKKVQPPEVAKNHPMDVAFYELRDTRGWEQLKELVQTYIDHLDGTLNITEHDSVTDIGYKYLAASVAKQYLNDLLNTVETSYRVVKQSAEQSE